MQQGKEQESKIIRQMRDYHSGNDELRRKAVDEIVADHSPFIYRIINQHFSSFKPEYAQDMYQHGVLGILEALKKYDPAKSRPTTFFHFYVIHEISTFVAENVHCTTAYCASSIKTVNRAIRDLEKEGKTDPTATDISMVTGMRVDAVKRALDAKVISQPHSCGDESYLDSLLSTYQDGPDMALEASERIDTLKQAIIALPQIERTVIILKYGLFGYEKTAHSDIAKITGVSVAKIRYYQQSAIRILRKNSAMKSVFSDYARHESVKQIAFTESSVAEKQMAELEDL